MSQESVEADQGSAQHAPDPDAPSKPQTPAQVSRAGWKYTARKAYREFAGDACTDLAAGLTYYAVLSLFPALIALFSVLGVVGQSQATIDTVMPILDSVVGGSTADTLRPVVTSLAGATGAGLRDRGGTPDLQAAPDDACDHPGGAAAHRRDRPDACPVRRGGDGRR